jgi:nucleoside 2-deoxyribosyltransferase
MGMNPPPAKCHITDMPTENRPSGLDAVEYCVEYNKTRYCFTFPYGHKNSELVERNKYILRGLLINKKFPFPKGLQFLNNELLEKIINEAQIPRTPKSKLDALLLHLYDHQEFAGAIIDLHSESEWEDFLYSLYFKNNEEYWFYLSTLKDLGLITFIDASSKDGDAALNIQLTYQGLEYIISFQEEGENSKKCFIAMSFDDTTSEIRRAIKKVVSESGYEPLLVDELHYDSDVTVNDAIIRFIKESKFVVADFTDQKHGVYFEAGFALGLKRPVIYTCSKKDFEKTHFDTNHYPHIVYDDLKELENKLRDKIQAWIE